ncbi:MAG: DUF4288 domain-containing protein [Ignavibacteria bacterium]|jgi:hypothetical protein|nr:DUF4288 domain-containing protein [Ignavibacteria bacterium]MCU7504780.1 DUF4288 domain-containing protein [Ignavibacteria bacterium]MCU7518351.1 DUF4288 domain-containing protein [Ignavibacteria bacterium]
MSNKWYSTSLLFEGVNSGKPETEYLWEESIVLFFAKDEEEAIKKANLYGINSETEYESVSKDIVKWKFRHILGIQEVLSDKISDGTEVFSRHLRASEVTSLRTPFDGE